MEHDRRQKTGLYKVPFRNGSSYTFPPYGVAVVSYCTSDGGTDLVFSSVTDSTASAVCGILVNGEKEVPAGLRGTGYLNVGPVPALYYTSDGTPQPGEMWGPKYGVTDFMLRKGYGGFTIAGVTPGGSGSTSRIMVVPEFRLPQRIAGSMYRLNYQIANADTGTRIIAMNLKTFGLNGNWPSGNADPGLTVDTSTGQFTVNRAGLWLVDANWVSEASPRFASPFQSKVNRATIQLYKAGSSVSGAVADYYHISLANADTTPSAGFAVPVPASLRAPVYCAVGDTLDIRATISEVTADSGTATEGYINFRSVMMSVQYLGPQLWRNDY